MIKYGFGEHITLIGVKPEYEEADYGYIKFKTSKKKFKEVDKFIEKPSLRTAKKYLKSKNFLWNTGIFIGKQNTFNELLKKYYMDHSLVKTAVQDSSIRTENKVSYILLSREFSKVSNDSFDKSVLERTSNIKVIKANIGWRDIGSWKSIYKSLGKDKNQNSFFGSDIHSHNVNNTLVYKTNLSNKKEILVADISNLAVVDTQDALLITNLNLNLLMIFIS